MVGAEWVPSHHRRLGATHQQQRRQRSQRGVGPPTCPVIDAPALVLYLYGEWPWTTPGDPEVYARFATERDRPVGDLLAMIPTPSEVERVVDLGCGTGALTARLHALTAARETIGVDSSAAMLAEARPTDGLRFVQADLATFEDTVGFDLVFANASLQWVPDHPSLFDRVWSLVRPGGQLAVQVPANFDHPSHTIADRLGRAHGLEPLDRSEQILTPVEYATLLHDLGAVDERVRLEVYGARLDRTDDIVAWVQGSLLTHYRRELGDRFGPFLAEYTATLLADLGDPGGDRPHYYPFPRILMTARRPPNG